MNSNLKMNWMALIVPCGLALMAVSAEPVWGVLNNGFETAYVYGLAEDGEIQVYVEATGAWVSTLGSTSGWETLTFSGSGTTDARLFVAKTTGGFTDVRIEELDSTGSSISGVNLSARIPSTGSDVCVGNIRWSKYYPTSLFVSARSSASGSSKGMVWELDLGLSTLKHTYTGPIDKYTDQAQTVEIAMNDNNGTIYMVGYCLNEPEDPNPDTTKGDLIAFTSTTTWNVLIDGDNYGWFEPWGPVWRKSNPTDGTPTIWIGRSTGSSMPVEEFYLDTTLHPMVNGSLVLRGSQISLDRIWNGQQDEVSWAGLIAAWNTGGISVIYGDDSTLNYQAHNYWDVDSPPYGGPLAPMIRDPQDPEEVLGNVPYVKQMVLLEGSPPVTWSLEHGPAGAQIDQTGKITGWTPSAADRGVPFAFEVKATNTAGSDVATWDAIVFPTNNGFATNYIYAAHDQGIPMIRESNGELIGVLSPGEYWESVTFSGVGRGDDARLFAARPENGNDFRITEFNAAGGVVRTNMLSTITGHAVWPSVDFTTIRYSSLHNSLFLGVSTDTNNWVPALAYEIDLNLSTRLHTYQASNVNVAYGVAVDIDPAGTLYMTHHSLGGTLFKGDLIAFNTVGRAVGGTTTAYTTLIDATTYVPPANVNALMHTPIYRGKDNPTGRPTVLMVTSDYFGPPDTTPEFYLDAKDGNGNLAYRGIAVNASYGAYAGQLDKFTKQVWIAAHLGGIVGLWRDDTTTTWWLGAYGFWDAASPPFEPCNSPPPDIDADGDVDMQDFSVLQLCYTMGTESPGPLSQECKCLDLGDDDNNGVPDFDGDIDSFDLVAFVDCASGPGVPADPACAD